jgi:hypothetical protein
LTADEAKEKWCPFSRIAISSTSPMGGVAIAGVNRPSDTGKKYNAANCIAGRCMMWTGGGCGMNKVEP